jgi:hypothetical protein
LVALGGASAALVGTGLLLGVIALAAGAAVQRVDALGALGNIARPDVVVQPAPASAR